MTGIETVRPNRLVDDEQVHSAMEYLRDSAHKLGAARTRARHAESMLKHIEALEFKKSDAKSADAKKADARTSDRFIEAIFEDAVATGELTKLYALREAASAVVESWRTESATIRAMKI
jgi:hypothetical protein